MPDPHEAWGALPAKQWNSAAARHLCSRLGFSVNPNFVSEVEAKGPRATIAATLGGLRPFEQPKAVAEMAEGAGDYRQELREAPEAERQAIRQKRQQQERESYAQFALDWYTFARRPAHSVQEKMVGFFQNVWVVSFEGVRETASLFGHQDRIRHLLRGTYPEMCRVLARSPAMVRYLNLQQNSKESPNENFARELFELFTLGEGHYSEADVRETARALTGWQFDRTGGVRFNPRRHDDGEKTVFGERARYDLDGIIEVIFRQPAAARFLPQELARHYLHPGGLPEELLAPLADAWRAKEYSLPFLYETFFASQTFFAPEYRGQMIKSPEHFALGVLQDLGLDVLPFPRRTVNALRLMGQPFFNPPNVRGWVGDRHWINSATLTARRQFVENLLRPLDEESLNADERQALEAARAEGRGRFSIDQERLVKWLGEDAEQAGHKLAAHLYVSGESVLLPKMLASLAEAPGGKPRARAWLLAALTSPEYNLS